MRRIVPLLTIALLLAAKPVSGDDGTSDTAKGEEAASVKRVLRTAVRSAIKKGNFERTCRFATPRGRRRLIAGFSWFDQREYSSCEEVLRAQIDNPANQQLLSLLRRRIVVSVVRIRGDRARVTVSYERGPDADSAWFALRKVGAKWRIINSEAIPPPCQCGEG